LFRGTTNSTKCHVKNLHWLISIRSIRANRANRIASRLEEWTTANCGITKLQKLKTNWCKLIAYSKNINYLNKGFKQKSVNISFWHSFERNIEHKGNTGRRTDITWTDIIQDLSMILFNSIFLPLFQREAREYTLNIVK